MSESSKGIRIDKWLWAARFYKTRALAVDAIKQGRVLCNRERPKPSRAVREGDQLRISKGALVFELEIVALTDQRGPASIAQTLYQESAESQQRRASQAAERRAQRMSAPSPPQTRPDKHARQRIRRLLGK